MPANDGAAGNSSRQLPSLEGPLHSITRLACNFEPTAWARSEQQGELARRKVDGGVSGATSQMKSHDTDHMQGHVVDSRAATLLACMEGRVGRTNFTRIPNRV